MKQFANVNFYEDVFEVGDRRCYAKVKFMVSRFTNNETHPAHVESTKPKLEDLEIDLNRIMVYSNDNFVGTYDAFELPSTERKYWESHIRAKVSKYVIETDEYKYDWFSDGSTF